MITISAAPEVCRVHLVQILYCNDKSQKVMHSCLMMWRRSETEYRTGPVVLNDVILYFYRRFDSDFWCNFNFRKHEQYCVGFWRAEVFQQNNMDASRYSLLSCLYSVFCCCCNCFYFQFYYFQFLLTVFCWAHSVFSWDLKDSKGNFFRITECFLLVGCVLGSQSCKYFKRLLL